MARQYAIRGAGPWTDRSINVGVSLLAAPAPVHCGGESSARIMAAPLISRISTEPTPDATGFAGTARMHSLPRGTTKPGQRCRAVGKFEGAVGDGGNGGLPLARGEGVFEARGVGLFAGEVVPPPPLSSPPAVPLPPHALRRYSCPWRRDDGLSSSPSSSLPPLPLLSIAPAAPRKQTMQMAIAITVRAKTGERPSTGSEDPCNSCKTLGCIAEAAVATS
mmetsp:Transcript_26183/g.55471  ORF Transcript_26183/g.55471 Transcript_26183/m.55471 type:complete len:220 (+) Transcript_26183:433-1092(+)